MYQYAAKCIRVIDGDTLDLDVDLGFDIHFQLRVRLLGVNTPETSGPKAATEKEAGLRAKARVEGLVRTDKVELLSGLPASSFPVPLTIETAKDAQDKYGRYLARIILPDGKVLNDLLLAEGLAVPMGR